MRLFEAVRQRAKWIETEADALIERHGGDAYSVACRMERQANNLSATLFWRAIKDVIASRRPADGVDILSPLRSNNCISLSGPENRRNAGKRSASQSSGVRELLAIDGVSLAASFSLDERRSRQS
jgi:hypothetical protein